MVYFDTNLTEAALSMRASTEATLGLRDDADEFRAYLAEQDAELQAELEADMGLTSQARLGHSAVDGVLPDPFPGE